MQVADFSKEIPFSNGFDIIVDRASVTMNNLEGVKNSIKQVKENIKNGGYFIGVDWYSRENSEYALGDQVDDEHTRIFVDKGEFANTGKVHFFDMDELKSLWEGWEIVHLAHKKPEKLSPKR